MAGQDETTLNVKIDAQLTSKVTDQLRQNLRRAEEIAKELKLSGSSKINAQDAMKKASADLDAGRLKQFNSNFGRLMDILSKATQDTGQVSKSIADLTIKLNKLQEAVNKNELKAAEAEKKANSAIYKREFIDSQPDKNKVLDNSGKGLSATKIKNILESADWSSFVAANPSANKWTNNLAQTTSFNGEFLQDRSALQALNRLAAAWEKERARITREEIDPASKEKQAAALELDEVKKEIEQIQNAAPEAANALEKLFQEIYALKNATSDTVTQTLKPPKAEDNKENTTPVANIDDNTETFQKNSNSLGKLVKNITIYHLALRAVRTTLRSTIHTIKELDKQLTEQAMVTGKTRKETYGLLKSYQSLALELGATTKEVAQVTTEYMRQGKTVEEAQKLAKAAISAAKVASISTSESVDYLTTALNGFRLSADDAMKVSDKFAAIAASAAVSYEEVATALSKVAAQANLAGMSIDYTTAILAKGIETTREAPETIGTALKTVIARMREIGDYGETLGGDTDLNNVESQLAYVGIELKNNNGELRSTEDVLDDLGKKWDTLNSNQQAAIAKALAGTRQQSRLIAMMTDYERVIELQEIAERSQGATMAQMATYTEGMEAAMNKVAVSWEKIVTTITDSDIIIGIVNAFANILNTINSILSNNIAMVAAITAITVLALKHLGIKTRDRLQQERMYRLSLQEHKIAQRQLVTEKKLSLEKAIQTKYAILSGASGRQLTAEEQTRLAAAERDIAIKQEELALAQQDLTYLENADSITGNIKNTFSDIGTGLLSMVAPLGMILTKMWQIVAARKASVVATQEQIVKDKEALVTEEAQEVTNKTNAAYKMAGSAAAIPVAGWVIAAGILAALIGVTIAGAMSHFSNSTEKTSDKIDKLSNEIYKLQKTKATLDTVISKFDAIDEKIIKTTEDLKTMQETLESAADSLSEEAGESVLDWLNGSGKKHKGAVSERDYYNSLQSDRAKREFLELETKALEEKLKQDRDKQIKLIAQASEKTRQAFFTEAKYANVRDAIYALDNAILNETIELEEEAGRMTTEHAASVRKFTQALLENMKAEQQWNYVQHPERLQELTKALQDLNTETSKGVSSSVDILGNSSYSLREQVQAYKDISEAIRGDSVAYESFTTEYQAFDVFTQLSESALDFADKAGLSVDKINDIYTAYHKLQAAGVEITKEDFQGRFYDFLENLATFENDAKAAIEATFGDILAASENQSETFQALIKTFSSILETGLLNMGQNITTFKNSVNSFYEKAKEWATMSDTDKTSFMTDYIDLFSDEAGEDLAKALENGNYAALEQALKDNKAFQDQRLRLLQQVEEELKWELAQEGDAYNAAYIKQLQQTKEFLSDMDKVFKADLNWRLEQEQNALEEYKNLLQQRADAETKQLEDRKKAYEDYFNEINEAKEDEDYEEQASLLIENISKLGASTNADAVKQTKDLQEQLEELEKERLQELQERAQQQILENLDEEINKISTQLEDIINNQQALLIAMNNQMQNPGEFIADLLSNKMTTEGLTQLGLQDYMNTLKETFAAFVDFDWSSLDSNIENKDSNNVILNINDTVYELDQSEQSSLKTTILNALQQMGYR